MISSRLFLVVVLYVSSSVLGHGKVSSPAVRTPGASMQSVCGVAPYTKAKSDLFGPIENSVAVKGSDYTSACDLFFCKGFQYADNTANVKTYAAGTVVAMATDIEAHHTGIANVSVADTVTRRVIGTPLYNWPVYANDSLGPADWPPNEYNWNITIPNLGTRCKTAGACVIQWWWYAAKVKQTYESCIDFVQ